MHISFLKKKNVEWICGNGITEIGGKIFFVAIGLWQCHCQKWEEKKIVVAEIWEVIKKKSATSTIFLQQITCD